MDTNKRVAIFTEAKMLSLCTLGVTNKAVQVASEIPVDRMQLAAEFVELLERAATLARLLGLNV